MSERITAANLDEVIKRNEVIEEQMKQSASLIWSKYNPMQINSPIQLALQILRPYGLIQLPIDNRYLSGAIFVRDTDMFLTEYIILAIHLNSQGALPDMVLNKVKENANLMV